MRKKEISKYKYIYIYIYIYIYVCVCVCVCVCVYCHPQTILLYHNFSVWLDNRKASSWDIYIYREGKKDRQKSIEAEI